MLGHKFTWERGRGTNHCVEERLDKEVVSPNWRDLFVDASVMNLHATTSDHSAIYLCLKGRPVRLQGWYKV